MNYQCIQCSSVSDPSAPEEQEDCVEERAEVVVSVDVGPRLQCNAAKHLPKHCHVRQLSQDDVTLTHLHADDGVDEEEHSDEEHDVGQRLFAKHENSSDILVVDQTHDPP